MSKREGVSIITGIGCQFPSKLREGQDKQLGD